MHNPENGSTNYEERWYAFTHGNIKVITLDSNISVNEQRAWLEDRLAEACDDADIDFVFAQFHHAHISETWVPGQAQTAADFVSRLVDFTATCNKPSVHFYGHSHSYQRGQTRDHAHFYMDVSGAEGDLAYWGAYQQANSEIIQKSIIEWGWSFIQAEGGNSPGFTMHRIGLGGEGRNYNISFPGTEIDTFTYRLNSLPPSTPSGVSPVNGASVDPSTIVLRASSFEGGEPGVTHLSSHFQVTTSQGNYSNPVEEQWFRSEDRYFGTNQNQGIDLHETKDRLSLAPDTTYYWRVRYRDSGFKWSEWSVEQSFVTGDGGPLPPSECLARRATCSLDNECCSGNCRSNGRCS